MFARILFAVAVMAAFITGGESQTCGGAGYDLSTVANVDMSYNVSGTIWRLRTCGNLNSTGNGACNGQLCQGSRVVSVYNGFAQWFRVRSDINGGNGVEQQSEDGESGGCTQPRSASIQFLCNTAATTPFISNITEPNTCIYTVQVQTSAACSTTGEVFVPGLSRNSPICGAGFYNIDTLNQNDLQIVTASNNYSIRVCGNVTNPTCVAAHPGSSICQVATSGGIYNLASYNGQSEIIYTLTGNGMWMFIQDGDLCGGTPRATNITFVCSAAATSPVVTFINEAPTCEYNFRILTNAVCVNLASSGGGVPVATASSSSTGAAVVGSQSSSSSAAVIGAQSSSSVVVTVLPSSSSGAGSPPGPANGAISFSPSIIAMIVAIIVAIIA